MEQVVYIVFFLLGVVIGGLYAAIAIAAGIYFSAPIKGNTNRLVSTFKEKGKILEPDNEELTNWADSLPKE